MALHSSLPIYKAVYDLLCLVTEVTRNMPRDYKHSIGARVRDECVSLTVLVFRANCAREKAPHIEELLERLQVAELLVRLSCDLRCISIEQYARVVALTTSVGKQATGWRKHFTPSPAA
ncbi:MAG TPA: four helix bundle protein [Burkholderiales bacterium]|nr:four helix bundle protein [Burkholderiales bacterium]